jgi:hypothetical protein
MGMERKGRGELHAVLRRMEDGIYRAEYTGELNPENPDERAFPDFHVSTSLQSVKLWVEQMAQGMGYSRVVWDGLPPN